MGRSRGDKGRPEGNRNLKRKKSRPGLRALAVVIVVLVVAGVGVLVYPTVSGEISSLKRSREISSYEKTVESMNKEEISGCWEEAEAYNASHAGFGLYSDAFDDDGGSESGDYMDVLNINGDGIMGYICIPKIDVSLPIYHGTSVEVLEMGAGHQENTQLPIGGEGNHAMLAGHRGLPTGKFFADLDLLEEGDEFYLCILDEVLAYEVDQILPMVEEDDYETLTAALEPVEGEDLVTLFTCTPYGINTHRLLVRGHRVPYNGELDSDGRHLLRDYYMLIILAAAVAAVIVAAVCRMMKRRWGSCPEKEGALCVFLRKVR
ncbi:MAG: class C sortase [Clostridiales bacterium]|nr:class C sortase [Clostridiales bacterium]